MIGSSGSVSSKLASVYASNTKALTDALKKLSTGKKFQSASEDLYGFIRSGKLANEISCYQKIRENLTEFKTYTSAAVKAGSTVYEDLTELKKLAERFAGTSDTRLKAEYESEFKSIKTQINKALSSASVDGKNLMQSTSAIASVELDPQGSGKLEMDFSKVTDSAIISSMTINGESITSDIDTQTDNMLTYLSEARAFDNIASQQLKLNWIIINNKETLRSLITDIDDASEMSNMIRLSMRQEASVAMIAQGNMIQGSLSMLYDTPMIDENTG